MGSLFKQKASPVTAQVVDPLQSKAFGLYRDALGDVNGQIRGNFMNQLANPMFGGQTYAGIDPMQRQFYDQSGLASNTLMQGGMNQYNATSDFGSRLANFGNYLRDPTQGMNYAAAFANSPHVQGMIDATARDYTRNLFENQIPGLNRAAIGGNNMNNTRAGVMEGTLRARTAEDIGDMSAATRFNALNTGLNQFNQNIGQQQANLGQLMSANQMGFGNMNNALGIMSNAGGFMRGFDQGALDDQRSRFYEAQTRPIDLASNYLSLFTPGASFNGGAGRGYASSINQGSTMDRIGQGMQIIGTGASLFCWVAREVYGEHNFKWRVFRHYMYFDAPRWLHNLYGKYGERFAALIHNKPLIKRALRKLMDKAIRQYGGPHGAI